MWSSLWLSQDDQNDLMGEKINRKEIIKIQGAVLLSANILVYEIS